MSPSMVQTVGGGLLVSPSLAQPRGFTLRVRPPRVATRRRPAACSELACCVRRPPRVVIAGPNRSGCGRHPPRVATRRRPATCACRSADNIPYPGVNPAHKIPPRVVIVVQTPPRVTVVVPAPPRVAIVVSIQRIRSLIVRGATKLLSLLWYKPGVRLPPRVANVVQTRGETLAGKPVDVSVSIR